MNEWSVECECVAGEWMSEWSADGMNVIVLHEFHATQVENGTVLSCCEAYIIYYDRSVWERLERETQEREDRNKECPFGRLLSTSLKPTTLHLHWDRGRRNYEKLFMKCVWKIAGGCVDVCVWWGVEGMWVWRDRMKTVIIVLVPIGVLYVSHVCDTVYFYF